LASSQSMPEANSIDISETKLTEQLALKNVNNCLNTLLLLRDIWWSKF
jgi:hypothetical protein